MTIPECRAKHYLVETEDDGDISKSGDVNTGDSEEGKQDLICLTGLAILSQSIPMLPTQTKLFYLRVRKPISPLDS